MKLLKKEAYINDKSSINPKYNNVECFLRFNHQTFNIINERNYLVIIAIRFRQKIYDDHLLFIL